MDWSELRLKLKLMNDRFVAAGWASGMQVDDSGFQILWTPLGRERIATLASLFRELDLEARPITDITALYPALFLEADESHEL